MNSIVTSLYKKNRNINPIYNHKFMKKLNFLDKNAINSLTTVGGAITMKTQKLNVRFKSLKALVLTALLFLGTGNVWAETYTLVTSAPSDWSGDYLIVAGTSALSGGTSSWGTFETVTVAGNDITTTSNIAVTISQSSGTPGTYYIYQNSNSTYLKEVTSNTFATQTTADTNTEWVISLESGSFAKIACASATSRHLRLNGTSGFRSYTTTTGTQPKLYKKQAPSYTITASSNNTAWGTVNLAGNVITATPASGYGYASPAYTVLSGTATVVQNGNDFTVTPSSDCAVRINFAALPTYTLTWNVNGSTSTTTVVQGQAIGTLPSDPPSSACDGVKVFTGWTIAPYSHATTAPSYISTATVPTSNATYYAVFATAIAGGSGGYEKVISAPADWSGTYILSTGTYVVTGRDGSNSYCGYAAHPASENTAYEFEVAKIGTTDYYSLLHVSTNTYIGGANSNTMSFTSTPPSGTTGNYHWSLSTTGLSTNTSSTRMLAYNTGAPRFTMYTPSSTLLEAFLYKKLPGTTYSDFTTTCCTPISPTISYSTYTVLVGNTIAAPTISGNTGNGAVSYTSSNTSVLTVNSSTGVVTAVSAGTAKVTASIAASGAYCAGSVQSSDITVTSGCTSATTSWSLGTTVNKTFGDANFTNTFNSNNTGTKTFSSSNTGVATVNASTGAVTIVGVGTATISVTQPETGSICAVNASYTLNVSCATLAVPSNFAAGTITHTTIDLSWTAVPNASSYTIEYTAGSTQTKSGITGTSTQLTDLTPSTAYSITIQAIGNGTTYCSSAKSSAINVSTTAIPTYTLTWNVNGTTSTTTVNQGDAIGTLPATPASCSSTYSTFVGWYTAASGTEASPSASPLGTQVTAATVPTANITYYAVFADASSDLTKLTSDIQVGDVVVFVYESAKKELTGVASSIGTATDYVTSPEGTFPLTVEAGTSGSSFAF